MKILTISLDKNLFKEGSEVSKRMAHYGQLSEKWHIIVFIKGRFKTKRLSDKVFCYPTNSYFKFLYFIDAFKIARKILKQEKIDLITSQDPFLTGLLAYFLSRLYKNKLLVGVYGTNVFNPYWLKDAWFHRILKFIAKRIFEYASVIQIDGPEAFRDLKNRYGDKVFFRPIIPGDIAEFKNIQPNFNEGAVKILFVGRLVKDKNLPMLLEVIKETLSGNGEKIFFTIVGDGPLKKMIEEFLENKDIKTNVNYLTWASREEMKKLMSEHQILMLCSWHEGFPLIVMEAAAAGLPVVSTNAGGVSEIIEDGVSGYLTDINDSEIFTKKLLDLINNPELLVDFSKNIKQSFWSKFDANYGFNKQKEIFEYLKNKK